MQPREQSSLALHSGGGQQIYQHTIRVIWFLFAPCSTSMKQSLNDLDIYFEIKIVVTLALTHLNLHKSPMLG